MKPLPVTQTCCRVRQSADVLAAAWAGRAMNMTSALSPKAGSLLTP
jgi:hypothetical protein